MNVDAIGGFLPLELTPGRSYHFGLACESLNTARNCLEYLLIVENYERVFLPYFLCDALMEPIHRRNVKFEFYYLDELLEPVFDFNLLKEKDGFLYINYFGIKDEYVQSLVKKGKNVILDNAQAFFAIPRPGVNAFYSARKFFGVPDGAYLYTKVKLKDALELDFSYTRMEHLIRRIDQHAESAYNRFLLNENELKNQPIRLMSKLTNAILASVSYSEHKLIRKDNFFYYHNKLKDKNLLKIGYLNFEGPLSYPFWVKDPSIKQILLEHRIYTPTYWPNIITDSDSSRLEFQLASEIVHLPVDQRYSRRELDYILKLIE